MRFAKKSLGFAVFLAILASPLLIWWKFDSIHDWWRLRDYSPPQAVASLADKTTMTPPARRIFYVNHPQIHATSEEFRRDCPQSEQTIVLGCYHSPQQGIAIYDISDPRLNGVEEVTAAHEMLHAAYDRLDSDDQRRINGLLNEVYSQLSDTRIIETIEQYKKNDPSQLLNEMHSIFGTELATLPAELEEHYNRYFQNRPAVVIFARGYEKEFSSRLSQIRELEAQLAALKNTIDTQEGRLAQQTEELESDRRRLDELRDSNRLAEYNSSVPAFNAKVNSYNQSVNRLRRDIASYNELLGKYNSIAGELKSLYDALDTRLVPQTAQ